MGDLANLLAEQGVKGRWREFLMIKAYGESKGNIRATRGVATGAPEWAALNVDQNEARAAEIAYDRNAKYFESCWPKNAYLFGSGGWWGMLPGNALAAFKGTRFACVHPWAIYDKGVSFAMALGFAGRLMGWSGYQAHPTMLNLLVGWGNPDGMGDLALLDEKRPAYAKIAGKVGIDADVLDEPMPFLSVDPVLMAERFGADQWLGAPS